MAPLEVRAACGHATVRPAQPHDVLTNVRSTRTVVRRSIPGVWSDNGFLMTSSSVTLTFTPWTDGVTVSSLKKSVEAKSLYDMYSF